MQESLLQAKLYRPRPAATAIPRERLLRRLDEGLDGRVTLVSATAGSGKSTLLSAWLERLTHGPSSTETSHASVLGWLTVDEMDAQLPRFLRYFVASIEARFPNACIGTTAFLLETSDPSIEAIADALANDLGALPCRFVLVLDDLHQVDHASIHALLARLVQHAPPTLHLVLSTRIDPPLPIVRWRALGWLNELRQDELYFTLAESAEFLAESLGGRPDAGLVAALHEYTEGWPVGMRLAALAARGHADTAAYLADVAANSNRHVIDYLGEDVLDQQPAALQHFLMSTAILKRFNPALCAAVLQIEEALAQQHLRAVERANLFLVDLSATRQWFRYHHQFQGMLLSKLNERYDQEDVASLYRRAAAWTAAHGEMPESLGYLLALGDAKAAADLLESRRIALLNRRQYPELAEALAMLPPRLVSQRPLLLLTLAWVQQWQLDRARAEATIDRLDQILSGAAPTATPEAMRDLAELEMAALRAGLDVAPVDKRSIEYIKELWARALPHLAQIHSAVVTILAERCQMLGAVETGIAMVTDALDRHLEWPALAACHLLNERGLLQFWAVNIAGAEQDMQASLQLAQRHGLPTITGPCRLVLGAIAAARNQLDLAEAYLVQVVSDFHVENGRYAVLSMNKLLEISAFRGSAESVRPYVERLHAYARAVNLRYLRDHVAALEAFLAMATGDLPQAMTWALAAPREPLLTTMVSESDRVPLARVRILMAEGSTSSLHMATAILEELLSLHQLQHHWYFVIETQIWQAMAYVRLGEPEAALAALDAAVRRAVPSGIVGLFTLHGQPMKELLYALRKRTSTPDLVDLLLATFSGSPSMAESEDELGKLTERELEVLRLLADGLSNKEIAQHLIISTNTVRNHMANIFDKLEVDSRTRATARARSLGLVPGGATPAPAGKETD